MKIISFLAALLLGSSLLFVICGCSRSRASAATTPEDAAVEITTEPDVLLSDRPTADLTLNARRLGDSASNGNQPFGQVTVYPYRFGVVNGVITSMICPGDRLKSLTAEPTVQGLQMRLGKADEIIEAGGQATLYWYGRKRAAALRDGKLQWFAVYR